MAAGPAALSGCEIAMPAYGRRRFNLTYDAPDYDGLFYCGMPDTLVSEAGNGNIVVTHVDILFNAAASEGTYIFFRLAKTLVAYLESFTLTKTPQALQWQNIDVCSIPSTMPASTRAAWFQVTTTGGLAGDDAQIAIRGYIEKPDAITPVSLEAYKWPLTRRH